MSSLDVAQLLAPVSDDAPAGENLEYDDQFGALEMSAQGTPEKTMGDQTIAAVEPDWSDVKSAAVDLLGRTKDLRVGVHLVNAVSHKEGFDGLADGLAVIHGMLENFWEQVHPELDEDDDDPTLRVNTLLPLSDPALVLGAARTAPMVASTVLGKFSLRDLWIAKGDIAAPSGMETLPEVAHIDGAFLEAELDDLTATAAAVERAVDSVAAIESTVTEQVGAVNAPDLSLLLRDLKEIQSVVSDNLARRGVEGFAESSADGGDGAQSAGSGAVNTREDVVRSLDRICDYFQRNEPTSPIPLLLRRAQRMVKMDFLEILREMTPDGVHQAETVFGVQNESNE